VADFLGSVLHTLDPRGGPQPDPLYLAGRQHLVHPAQVLAHAYGNLLHWGDPPQRQALQLPVSPQAQREMLIRILQQVGR